ncbi:hypothetical protein [Anaerotruncus rubiinfantis]|uniref:hypothetical protein n=1 Tax=Anaerotruncus rubiinfantis TaxID=1720200 RepID=UPI0011C9F978|nr:hypothetical protein [Anaerotruncus rubiinfantis]
MKGKPYIVDGQRVSHAEYEKARYDDLRVRIPKGKKEAVIAFAAAHGESLNAFINRLIDEAMENETPPANND